MSLYVRIFLKTLAQLFNNFQYHTQIDLRYTAKVGSVVIFTSWSIQKLSSLELNKSTESTSTTALGKLFQILTILLVNENFLKL